MSRGKRVLEVGDHITTSSRRGKMFSDETESYTAMDVCFEIVDRWQDDNGKWRYKLDNGKSLDEDTIFVFFDVPDPDGSAKRSKEGYDYQYGKGDGKKCPPGYEP